jgi:hypothetical protein
MILKIFHKLVCFFRGHTREWDPMAFFRSWNNLHEIGSLHCKRCGAMLGEYKKNLAEPVQ